MSTTFHPASASVEAQPSKRRTRLPDWAREPLLHFVLLGTLLFAIDYFVAGRDDDPHTIIVDAKVDGEARRVFEGARGRPPNPDELRALRQVWLDNEVLYREGLALQVDKGDTAIRERVIFKALSVIDAGLKRPPADEKVLRDWFESNRAKYDEPTRFDFEEAVLAGDVAEVDQRAFAAALNAGTPGDTNASLRVFKGRPHANLVHSYGEEFAKALEASPAGEWRILPTSGGMRVMRLLGITPARPAVFESLAGVVQQDWTDAVMAEQRTAAVRALAKKYTVEVEASSP